MEEEEKDKEKQNDDSAAAAKEAAEKAAAQAKEAATNAAKVFKSMDLHSQIYLGSLAVVVFCGLFFKAASFSASQKRAYTETEAIAVRKSKEWINSLMEPLIGSGFWGILAVLAAVAGIGIFIWAMVSKPKDAWVPLAVAGAAGLCTLCLLIILVTGFGSMPDVHSGTKYSFGGTLLGFYLPLLGAAAATAVAVMRIVKA